MSSQSPTDGMPTAQEIIDTQAKKAEHIRESWVKTMEVRLVKEELNKCYRGEGVNAKQYCRELAERYASMLQENRLKGYVQVDQL